MAHGAGTAPVSGRPPSSTRSATITKKSSHSRRSRGTSPSEWRRSVNTARDSGALALSQRMEAVGQLSGGIAHDFNNLLMIIMGNLERVRHDAQGLGESAANLLRSIASALRGAQRAAALTQRLLAFSRHQPLNPTLLDLNKYLPGAGDFCNAHSVRRLKSRSSARPGSGPSRSTFRSSKRASSTLWSTPETRCRMAAS